MLLGPWFSYRSWPAKVDMTPHRPRSLIPKRSYRDAPAVAATIRFYQVKVAHGETGRQRQPFTHALHRAADLKAGVLGPSERSAWIFAVISQDAQRIENESARLLHVEPAQFRDYITEVLEDRLRRGGEKRERSTGFRFVRGTHGGGYVRDPEGNDVLPPGVQPPERASKMG